SNMEITSPMTASRLLPGRPLRGETFLDRVHVALGLRRRLPRPADAELRIDLPLDVGGDVGVLDEEVARVLLALSELITVVGVPGPGLLHDLVLDTEVEQGPL